MAGKHDGDWDDSALLAHLEEADSGKESTAVEHRLAALEREVAALKAEVATLKNSGGRAHATAGVAQPAAKQPRIDSSLTTAAPGASSSFFPAPSTGTAGHPASGPVQEVVISLNKRAAISTYKNANFVDLRETYVDQTGEVRAARGSLLILIHFPPNYADEARQKGH